MENNDNDMCNTPNNINESICTNVTSSVLSSISNNSDSIHIGRNEEMKNDDSDVADNDNSFYCADSDNTNEKAIGASPKNDQEMNNDNSYVSDNDNSFCFADSGNTNKKAEGASEKCLATNALNSLLAYGDSSDDDFDGDNVGAREGSDSDINVNINKVVTMTSNRDMNNESRNFVDMSLTFPRTQKIIDDDALSLSSTSSSSSSSTSLNFSLNRDISEDDFDDDVEDIDDQNDNKIRQNNEKKNEAAGIKNNKKKQVSSKKNNLLVTPGELTLEDLPAIEDLQISVPKDQCVLLGKILSTVDKLVIVQALKDLPALDLDTVLFLEWNKPLGQVFDVVGPVVEPLYCVRFNSTEHIQMKDISVGMPVYFVPKSKHTKYVFLAHLMKMKGSDASWEDNNEPPLEFLEYSDDEEERKAKKLLKKVNIKKEKIDSDEPRKKKPTAYERRMNKRNLRMSEMQKHQSQNKKPWKQSQLIHPPSFLPPPPPPCDYQTNCITPELTSLGNRSSFDLKSSYPANSQQNINIDHKQHDRFSSFNLVDSGVSPGSSGLPRYFPPNNQPCFQPPFNQSDVLIPNRPPPSVWAFTPMVSNTNFHNTGNVFLPPRPSPSNIFSSPPPCFSHFTGNPSVFSSSSAPTPYPPINMFSSPPPTFSNNSPLSSAFNAVPGPSNNHVQRTLSPFPSFSGNSEASNANFNPFATPPPNRSSGMYPVPPPKVTPNSNSELQGLPASHSSDRRSYPESVPVVSDGSNNFHSTFPVAERRLPWLARQNHRTFQNNFQRPSNPTPPNSRF